MASNNRFLKIRRNGEELCWGGEIRRSPHWHRIEILPPFGSKKPPDPGKEDPTLTQKTEVPFSDT